MQKIPQWVWIAASVGLVYVVWKYGGKYLYNEEPLPDESEQGVIPEGSPEPQVSLPSNDAVGPAQSSLDFIKGFEGFSATPYIDRDGFSIGHGHYMGTANPPPISSVTPEQAQALLLQDVATAAQAIDSNVDVTLSRNMYDALLDFVYNVGAGNFANSTLLKKLNAGDYDGAAAEFKRWIYSGKVMLNALIRRRAAEQALFSRGY